MLTAPKDSIELFDSYILIRKDFKLAKAELSHTVKMFYKEHNIQRPISQSQQSELNDMLVTVKSTYSDLSVLEHKQSVQKSLYELSNKLKNKPYSFFFRSMMHDYISVVNKNSFNHAIIKERLFSSLFKLARMFLKRSIQFRHVKSSEKVISFHKQLIPCAFFKDCFSSVPLFGQFLFLYCSEHDSLNSNEFRFFCLNNIDLIDQFVVQLSTKLDFSDDVINLFYYFNSKNNNKFNKYNSNLSLLKKSLIIDAKNYINEYSIN